jgi:hypothetical protein
MRKSPAGRFHFPQTSDTRPTSLSLTLPRPSSAQDFARQLLLATPLPDFPTRAFGGRNPICSTSRRRSTTSAPSDRPGPEFPLSRTSRLLLLSSILGALMHASRLPFPLLFYRGFELLSVVLRNIRIHPPRNVLPFYVVSTRLLNTANIYRSAHYVKCTRD